MRTGNGEPSDFWLTFIESYQGQSSQPFTELFAEDMLDGLSIGPTSGVLDVGAGIGTVSLAALKRGAKVLAIDASAGLVERLSKQEHPGLEAQHMDGEALALPDGSFDAVLSLFGVTLFADWRAGLREMARVTRRGGSGVVGAWKYRAGGATHLFLTEIRHQLFSDSDALPSLDERAELGEPTRLSDAMHEAGFERATVREVTHPFRLKLSILEDMDRHLGMMPVWTTLAPHQKEAVIKEIKRRAEQQGVRGTLSVHSTALIARALRR